MSEQLSRGHDADIIEFPQMRVEELDDEAVIESFFANLDHPSVAARRPDVIAEIILRLGGHEAHEGVSNDFRARLTRINMETPTPSEQNWDAMMDEKSETYDAGFAAIVRARIHTKSDEQLLLVRNALWTLFDAKLSALRLQADQERINPKIISAIGKMLPDL